LSACAWCSERDRELDYALNFNNMATVLIGAFFVEAYPQR
jgi:hypothetical protein